MARKENKGNVVERSGPQLAFDGGLHRLLKVTSKRLLDGGVRLHAALRAAKLCHQFAD